MALKLTKKEWENNPQWAAARAKVDVPATVTVKPVKVGPAKPAKVPAKVSTRRKVALALKNAEKPATRGARALVAPMPREAYRPMYPAGRKPMNDIDTYPYERWDVDHPVAPGRFDHLQARPARLPRNYTSGAPAVATRWKQPAHGFFPDYPMAPRRGHLSGRGYF